LWQRNAIFAKKEKKKFCTKVRARRLPWSVYHWVNRQDVSRGF
jgi:hypothetical protein